MTPRDQTNFTPAMAVSVLLHVGVFALTLVAWPHLNKPAVMTGVTSVTLVDAPAAAVSTAVQAEEESPAATEQPVPDAPPEMAATEPAPQSPPPPPRAPAPSPTPTPAKSVPATSAAKAPAKPQSKPAPKQSADDFLASLTKSLPSTKAGGSARSGAQKGPNKPQTAASAREGRGAASQGLADATALMKSRLMRAWRPNCGVEGADRIVVRVKFSLNQDGSLKGQAVAVDRQVNAVWQAAATRAEGAVGRAAPFTELPKDQYASWKDWEVDFVGETACRYQ